MVEKELKYLTIDEFMKIGEAHCNKSIYDHSPCHNIDCPFHNRWSCNVYDLLSHVQEEEYNKKYTVPVFTDNLAHTNIELHRRLAFCNEYIDRQHATIKHLINVGFGTGDNE